MQLFLSHGFSAYSGSCVVQPLSCIKLYCRARIIFCVAVFQKLAFLFFTGSTPAWSPPPLSHTKLLPGYSIIQLHSKSDTLYKSAQILQAVSQCTISQTHTHTLAFFLILLLLLCMCTLNTTYVLILIQTVGPFTHQCSVGCLSFSGLSLSV